MCLEHERKHEAAEQKTKGDVVSGMKNICPLPSLWETGVVKSYTVLRTNQKYVAPWNQRKMINNKNKNLLYMKVNCK